MRTTPINPGEMDREITVQMKTESQSTSGEVHETWSPDTRVSATGVVWAQWKPAGTREAWKAQQRLAAYVDGVFITYDMDTRPTPDGSRIVFEGRTFDVKGITEIGRKDGLEIAVVARGE